MTTRIMELYKKRLTNIDGALKNIQSNDFIIAALGGSEPIPLLEELHRVKDLGVRNCELSNCLPMKDYEFIKNPEYQDAIFTAGWFYSPIMRKANKNGNVSFAPQHLHNAFTKRLYARDGRRLVLLCSCSSMDKHGYLTLSLGTTYERHAIEEGAFVIAVVNSKLPRTFGDTIVHVSEVDVIIEADYEVPTLPIAPINELDQKIGDYIAELVEDGSTIQLGIGGIPNAVAEALKVKKHLGIHTEMFTDGMVDLLNCGAVDNSHKTLYKGKTIATFALGSGKLYDFIDDNPSVVFKYGKWTNSPYVVGQNHKMVSINTTIEVDLSGQCASESIGPVQFSGTGGQSDTAIGAQLSPEGKSFIALYSTTDIKDKEGGVTTISKIVPMLKQGAAVSLSRNDVDYVVTEYGAVRLRGRTIKERVERLISIAHPDFRDQLRFEAKQHGIW
ncbi:acetyl-CoA hydrolase/transferase family protein [Alkaliphilus serpentinus]|uniref:Acetyl-CoA hydrolase/transferase family protein n=1 Tax=Alkaliphilus serpentinus TaxID=1482731 RepID=A0A833HPK5_9FIRM|nr:acetyl-CoA hydrolase/transferase C-terminal domain-containing protein [Alkaliphilus serpentinus]KAB3530862.1 acetyl-CoA hydrolase/transferase family protein [Alkaliphilus serpentinus]